MPKIFTTKRSLTFAPQCATWRTKLTYPLEGINPGYPLRGIGNDHSRSGKVIAATPSRTKPLLRAIGLAPLVDPAPPGLCVVAVVAALAESGEIEQARRLRPIVENVGGREYHARAGNRMRPAMFRAAPFAATFCAHEAHEVAAPLPVGWIASAILRTNRHRQARVSAHAAVRSVTWAPRGWRWRQDCR